jgi:hypothetical protein
MHHRHNPSHSDQGWMSRSYTVSVANSVLFCWPHLVSLKGQCRCCRSCYEQTQLTEQVVGSWQSIMHGSSTAQRMGPSPERSVQCLHFPHLWKCRYFVSVGDTKLKRVSNSTSGCRALFLHTSRYANIGWEMWIPRCGCLSPKYGSYLDSCEPQRRPELQEMVSGSRSHSSENKYLP